jgi:hypothetical protein
LADVRPFKTTVAPASAKPLAMAKPIPSVDPVTIAILCERSIFMRVSGKGFASRSGDRGGAKSIIVD